MTKISFPSPVSGRSGLRRLGSLLLVGAALWAGPAFGQAYDLNTMVNRLNRLENDVQTLNQQIYRGAAPAPGIVATPGTLPSGNLAADMEVRLTRLEREVELLTGRIEEATHAANQARDRLDKLSQDVDQRLMDIEDKLNGTGTPTASAGPERPAETGKPAAQSQTAAQTPPAASNQNKPANQQQQAATGALPSGSAQEQYERAYSLLRNADYPKAEAALSQFLKAHPNHAMAHNAQYWLAETYYVRGKFKDAAVAFAEGYQKNPKGSKAPDNLLKLGLSLSAMNQKDDACLAFAQLNKEFPTASASVKRRAEQERTKLGCK